jgi:hypothetical protein
VKLFKRRIRTSKSVLATSARCRSAAWRLFFKGDGVSRKKTRKRLLTLDARARHA